MGESGDDEEEGVADELPPLPEQTEDSSLLASPAFSDKRRVTLEFVGPPLALPEDRSAGSAAEDDDAAQRAERPTLELDTSELEEPQANTPSVPSKGRPSHAPLDLDLEELDSMAPPTDPSVGLSDGHDAWAMDRARRSTVPPTGATMPRPVRVPKAPPLPRAPAPLVTSRSEDWEQSTPIEASLAKGDEADALGLVDRSKPSTQELDFASEMVDRYALGDFSGSLQAAELLLGRVPDHEQALRYAESSRLKLEQLYVSRLGSLSAVLRMAVAESEVRWLGIDHRAGFVLSLVDGTHTVDEVVEISGMPRLDALKTLAELLGSGIVAVDEH